MKSLKKILAGCMILFTFSNVSIAQRRGHHPRPAARAAHHHHRVVARSVHRPAVAAIYHPHWAPHRDFHRRWVYFPKHRLYWDNWRNLYFYNNGTIWVSSPALPAHLVHLKLEKEKCKEISEAEEDDDEIYLHH